MSPRTGRPPANNPKNVRVELRLSEEEGNMLEYCCKESGMTKTDVIRKGIRSVYEPVSYTHLWRTASS